MKRSLVLAFGLLLCMGCGKDDVPSQVALPRAIYTGAAIFESDPVIMYTGSGQITDPAVIQEYMDRYSLYIVFDVTANGWMNNATASFDNRDPEYVRFKIIDTAIDLTFVDKTYDREEYLNNAFVFTDIITNTVERDIPGPLACRTVNTITRTHRRLVDCPIPVGICNGKERIPVLHEGNKIIIPNYSYHYSYTNGNLHCYINGQNIRDVFNETSVKNITSFDTMLVKKSRLVLEKKAD